MGKKSKPSGSKEVKRLNKWLTKRGLRRAQKWGKRQEQMEEFEFDKWKRNKGALRDIADQQMRQAEQAGGIRQQYYDTVEGFDTPERRASESAAAQAEVASQMDAARENALRRLESYGVDPSQTRNAALDSRVRIEEAKQKALAGTQARRDIEGRGIAMQRDVAGDQAGLMSEWDTPRGMDTGAIFGDAVAQGAQGAAALLKQGQNEQAQEQSQRSGIGSALGTGVGAFFGGPAGASIGGAIGGMIAEGGEIEGPGGPKDDAIPANLSDGEFVIPEEVVRRKGTEFFDKLIEKVKTENREREQNAQVFGDAMAVPPPEAVSPEGMPNPPQGIPAGMYQGGEMLVSPYPPGGATGQQQYMDRPAMYRGGEARQYAADPGEYIAPERAGGGQGALNVDDMTKALTFYKNKFKKPDPSMNREPVGAYGNPNFAMGGEARVAPIRSQSQALADKEMMASMPPPPTQTAPRPALESPMGGEGGRR